MFREIDTNLSWKQTHIEKSKIWEAGPILFFWATLRTGNTKKTFSIVWINETDLLTKYYRYWFLYSTLEVHASIFIDIKQLSMFYF